MKRYVLTSFLILIASMVFSQTYSFEVEMKDFKQINETEFQWDIYLRKGAGSTDFALYTMQCRWQYDNGILNGGEFTSDGLTIDGSGTELYQSTSGWLNNAHFTKVSGDNLNWAVINAPNPGDNVTIIDDTWRKVANFKAALSQSGNPHNFGDADPQFAFESSGLFVLVRRCDNYLNINPNATMVGGDNSKVSRSIATPDMGVSVNTRQLAGYWFSGEGNWADAARWNNVTTENKNTVPPLVTNNATIAGSCTLNDTRTINQLVVADGGYLVLNEAAELTTTDLYNDNQSAEKARAETIAAWDFDNGGSLPYVADLGISAGVAEFSFENIGDFIGFLDNNSIPGTSGLAAAGVVYRDLGFGQKRFNHWYISLSTVGYQNLKISSRQFSGAPHNFSVNYSIDGGGSWQNITTLVTASNWTTGVLSDLDLSSFTDLNNQNNILIQWIVTNQEAQPSAIDDIIITGEEIPPPPTGILIESTASGTGSLIHNNNNIEATIQRYIPATNGNSVYHLVSVPLTQESDPRSGLFEWSYLFNFDVATQEWLAMGTSLYNPLFVDQGYMIYKYPGPEKWQSDTTYTLPGSLNNGEFTCNVTFPDNEDNHNLVPNPYPSAIDWDAASGWTKTNVYNAIWIWNPAKGNYASYIKGTGTNDGSQFIPVGQSFFVSATAASPALSMDNDVRVHNNTAFLKSKEELPDLLRVKALANNYSDEVVVRFAEGASTAFDGQFDATKFYGNADAPQLFSMSSDNKQLSINAMEVGTGKRFVDLGFKLDASGLCTFIFSGIESFNPDMQIHLTDRVTGQTIDLRANPEYAFAHSPENDPMRFELTFNGLTSINEAKTVNQDFFYVDGRLYLNFPQESRGPFNVTVYNINGQIEFMGVAHDARSVVDLSDLATGFHVVRVVSNEYSGEKKVLVK